MPAIVNIMKMHASTWSRLIRSAALALPVLFSLIIPAKANAACSRALQVPVSAIGFSIVIKDGNIGGIYVDLLREVEKEGCQFQFSSVPRARSEAMFEAGTADLLLPSTRTARRDELGIFIPMIKSRATIISLVSERPAISSAQDLIARKDLRLVLVRGFDFGPAYRSLVAELTQQGRVILEADVISVARMLKLSKNHISIMAPNILAGAIADDPRVMDLGEKLRFEPIDELPWGEAGLYISKTSLGEADKAFLQNALTRASKSGYFWKKSQQYYSADVLRESMRGLDATR